MQDQFGNPIPDPTMEPTPADDAPVVDAGDTTLADTPITEPVTDTPVADPATDTPITDAPTVDPVADTAADTPAADPVADTTADTPAADPVADTTADTPAADPVAEQSATDLSTNAPMFTSEATSAATPVLDQTQSQPSVVVPNGEKKSNHGVIIGVIIAILVIGIGIAATFIIMNLNKGEAKKDDTSSETKDKEEEKKDDKKDEDKNAVKPTSKSLEIGYNDKSFKLYKSYSDTVKSLSDYKVYTVDEDYNYVEITDVDEYLNTEYDSEARVRVVILDSTGEDDVFEINAEPSEDAKTIADLELGTVYFWPNTPTSFTIGEKTLTSETTTKSEILSLLGTPENTYDNGTVHTYDYKLDDFALTVFLNDDATVFDFATIYAN